MTRMRSDILENRESRDKKFEDRVKELVEIEQHFVDTIDNEINVSIAPLHLVLLRQARG